MKFNNIKDIVYVATPTYDGKFSITFLKSATEFCLSDQTSFHFSYVSGQSLLPLSRAILLSDFDKKKDQFGFTHFLWLDSDVYLPYNGLRKMIDRDVDSVSAGIPIKNDYSQYGIEVSSGPVYEQIDSMFYKSSYASTSAFLIKTKVIEDLIKYAEKEKLGYTIRSSNGEEQTLYDLFPVGINRESGSLMSEDYSFSSIIKKIGYEIYLDCSFYVEHSDTPKQLWFRPPAEINPGIPLHGQPMLLPESKKNVFFVPSFYI